jgi:biopolymer transport protein ExbD
MKSTKHRAAEVPAGSMADIAFLLLTFYMVTTTLNDDKGIALLLPPMQFTHPTPIHERNLFTVQINSSDQYLIENERRSGIENLRHEIKKFILNNNINPTMSVSPEKAIVSFKTDRGTSYKAFITTLDEIQAAYYEIYAQQAGITPDRFRKLDLSNPADKALYEKGKKGIPLNISIAESH